jgi:dolichol-phosphate mannosyltransferase
MFLDHPSLKGFARMVRISLVISLADRKPPVDFDIEKYRQALEEQGDVASVEVILCSEAGAESGSSKADSLVFAPNHGKNHAACLHDAMRVAAGDIIVVLEPSRHYAPEALGQVVQALRNARADLAIGVPARSRNGLHLRAGFALLGQLALGSRDIFSGLMAIRRGPWTAVVADRSTRGSRLALDLLARPYETRIDVPVTTQSDDRILPGAIRIDDLRQLKRVLDHRFGTFSRLVQFCMVGASGMVVDLSLYALFQLLFARFWTLPSGPSDTGFSWPLATARVLAILVALVWNFALNRRLTFNDARRGSIPRQFATYALGNALGIAVSLFLSLYLPLHVEFFAQHRLAAAVVGIVAATGISFSMSRWVVFIRRPESRVAPQQAQQAHLAVESALR